MRFTGAISLSLGRLASADQLPEATINPYAKPGDDPEAEARLQERIAARREHHRELVDRLTAPSSGKAKPRKHTLHELERRQSQASVRQYQRIMKGLRELALRTVLLPVPPSPDPSPATQEETVAA